MENSSPKKYKRYLQPGSSESIPSSTKYRYKKLDDELHRSERGTSNVSHDATVHAEIQSENMEMEEDDYRDTSMVADTDREAISLMEFQTYDKSETSAYDDGVKIQDVLLSLVDDLEDIEKNEAKFDQSDTEDNDYFFDALDNSDFEDNMNEEDNVGRTSEENFTSFDKLLNSKSFHNPINMPIKKTLGEIVLVILKFALVHAISLTELHDLCNMINCLFDVAVLPATKYFIDKLFYPRSCTHLHATCTKCGAYISGFNKKTRFLKCTVCGAEINVKDYAYKDFFVMLDISAPISKLLESNSTYYNYVVNDRVQEKGYLSDIYDGRRYRKFLENLNDTDRNKYATVVFNTDGAPLYTSSTYSIWPIFLMLNEIPAHVRTKELILVGLWFGKDKPNMNAFLRPFADSMNELSTKGVECVLNGTKKFIKIFVLICCVDCIARAPVQGFVQFNGSYGCNQCLHPGEWVRNDINNPRSGTIKYTLLSSVPKDRNMEDTIKHMKQAAISTKPILGVKSPSHLINLKFFDIIYGCVPEGMHCISGIAKQFATLWFGNKKKVGLFSRQKVLEIDAVLLNFKVPHQIVRLTRSLSDKEFWKAKEWENWVIYYSLPILANILPNNLLLHWALFVEAVYILSKDNVHTTEVDFADRLLHDFVARTEILYTKVFMTFNIHQLLHLARSVYDWGPLPCHNAYAFESGNGDLLKVVHAAKGVHNQICRRISLKYCLFTLKDHVYPDCSYSVKRFFMETGSTMVKKSVQVSGMRYFGPKKSVSKAWIEKLHLSPEKTFSYNKLVKNGCLYMTSVKSNKRSENIFAQLHDGSFVKIKQFIVDFEAKNEVTIAVMIQTINAFENKCKMLQKIVSYDDNDSSILTSAIDKICVHMVLDDNEYLSSVPNLYY